MAVPCEGDFRLIEQTGEKQDFELALTCLRFVHEDFRLSVQRLTNRNGSQDWGLYYRVVVRRIDRGLEKSYAGSAIRAWVDDFSRDAARGDYGPCASVLHAGPGEASGWPAAVRP